MSFKEDKRKAVKTYILNKIRMNDTDFTAKTMDNFQISVTTVKRYLKMALDERLICESDTASCGYELVRDSKQWQLKNDGSLEEDTFYMEEISPFLEAFSYNTKGIWYYSFTEIMNNAIEHSAAETIYCSLRQDCLYTEISIVDDGVGIYKSIQDYAKKHLGLAFNREQAVMELYKGRFTTNPASHSGEGIFFTSKMLDSFAILSENTIYSYRCHERDQFIQSHVLAYYSKLMRIGTMAVMGLENGTMRTSREVFDEFAPMDEGFVKTLIPLKELCLSGDPVARSQARRILRRLDTFREVIFDFDGINFMGQGFADEIFRVFQNRFPEVKLTVIHANKSVTGMIRHVQRI